MKWLACTALIVAVVLLFTPAFSRAYIDTYYELDTPTPTPAPTPPPADGGTVTGGTAVSPSVSPALPSGSPSVTPSTIPSATPAITPLGSPSITSSVTPFVPPLVTSTMPPGSSPTPAAVSQQQIDTQTVGAITDPVASAAGAVSVIGVLVALVGGLSGNMAEILGLFRQRLLEMFGLKKKPRPWGAVYDAATKQPLAFSRVELRNEQNRVLETRIADALGMYGFLTGIERSTYHLSVSRDGYRFPTSTIAGPADTALYGPIYRGGVIRQGSGGIVSLDVPLDPVTGVRVHPLPVAASLVVRTLDVCFWVAAVLLPVNCILQPSWLHIGLLVLFVALNSSRLVGLTVHPYGTVLDTTKPAPLPFSLVLITDAERRRTSFAVADERGRFIASLPQGSKQMSVFTPAQTQPSRSISLDISEQRRWFSGTVAL